MPERQTVFISIVDLTKYGPLWPPYGPPMAPYGPLQTGLVELHIKSKASESPMVTLIMRGSKNAKAYITKT